MPTAKKSTTEADPAAAAGESRSVDFKESFDPNSGRDWVELVKDIAAMANSGGGHVVFGVKATALWPEGAGTRSPGLILP